MMKTKLLKLALITTLIATTQTSFAQDYSELITEEYLRSEFTFKEGEKVKHAECRKRTYPTCEYIWDVTTPKSEKKDAKRLKQGLTPNGNEMMIVYAKFTKQADFQRVLATYKDAEVLEGIGTQAVWSQKRKQLSLITANNLIVHVHIEMKPTKADKDYMVARMMAKMQGKPIPPKRKTDGKGKAHAINVAKHILKQL